MRTRRTVLRGITAACTVSLAGCADILRGGPDPEVGTPRLEGSLVGNGSDTATVTVDVENTGPAGDIRVIADVIDETERVLNSYERTARLDAGETRTFEFEITPHEDAVSVTVRAEAT